MAMHGVPRKIALQGIPSSPSKTASFDIVPNSIFLEGLPGSGAIISSKPYPGGHAKLDDRSLDEAKNTYLQNQTRLAICPLLGFRYFLADQANEASMSRHPDNLDIANAPLLKTKDEPENKNSRRLVKLVRRLNGEGLPLPLADAPANLQNRDSSVLDNPFIPAGYTYFLQLMAHDMVATSLPISTAHGVSPLSINNRNRPLLFETLYGGGPFQSPLAYCNESGTRQRRFFRLGQMKANKNGDTPAQRDAPRIRLPEEQEKACPFRSSVQNRQKSKKLEPCTPAQTESLLADPRNDNHGIISQLTAAFALLHNGVLAQIEKADTSPENHSIGQAEADIDCFNCARMIVMLVYRHVIRHDVMRRILHPDIWQQYNISHPDFIDTGVGSGDLRPMVEFAFSAFRFGHSMAREHYHFSETMKMAGGLDLLAILAHNSQDNKFSTVPPDIGWIASWSRFFEIPGKAKPDLSRRILPNSTSALSDETLFPNEGDDAIPGLDFRDLLSESLVGMWRLTPLLECVRGLKPQLIEPFPHLQSVEHRSELLRRWLTNAPQGVDSINLIQSDDIDLQSLIDDPPLSFFIRFEASQTGVGMGQGGRHLGILGSVIVAEAVFGALVSTRLAAEDQAETLPEQMLACVNEAIGATALPAALAELANVQDMAGLLSAIPALHDNKIMGPDFL